MADYNESKLTKLGALKALAEKIKETYAKQSDFTALSSKVDGLVTAGGEPNKIEKIKVNGTDQSIGSDKSVNIKVPVKVSELTNDSKFQKDTEVAAAIKTEIAKSGHASFKVVTVLPEATAADDNVLYLFKNTSTKHYDIYAKVTGDSGSTLELLDDVTVDLSEYSKTTDITKMLENKVDKDGAKVLSTNDYTTAEKNKLKGIADNANNYVHPVSSAGEKASGLYKIATDDTGHVIEATEVTKSDISALGVKITDTTYKKATGSADGLMSKEDYTKLAGIEIADETEVSAMLDEVFTAE